MGDEVRVGYQNRVVVLLMTHCIACSYVWGSSDTEVAAKVAQDQELMHLALMSGQPVLSIEQAPIETSIPMVAVPEQALAMVPSVQEDAVLQEALMASLR